MADVEEVKTKILTELAEAVQQLKKPTTASGAQLYASQVAKALRSICRRNIGTDVLTDGFLTKDVASALIKDPLGEGWRIVAEATGEMQTAANLSAGVHIRATAAAPSKSRLKGMVTLASEGTYAEQQVKLYQCFDNVMRSAADSTIKYNASALSDAGIKSKVIRTADSGACEWCLGLAGVYDYDDVKVRGSDVWRRHLDCGCTIETIIDGVHKQTPRRVRNGA